MYYKTLQIWEIAAGNHTIVFLSNKSWYIWSWLIKTPANVLLYLFPDLDAKDKEELSESQGPLEDSTHLSSASSHGRRIRWLLSSASLGNIEEEMTSVEPRLESSASGATLEVRNTCIYNL